MRSIPKGPRRGPEHPTRYLSGFLRFPAVMMGMMAAAAWPGMSWAAGDELAGQDPQKLVTVRGQFVNPDERFQDFDWSELEASLIEVVQTRQPALPAAWLDMTAEQRKQWVQDFQASEEGQQLIAANRELLANRTIIEIEVGRDGKFVAWDVPPGQYDMQAAAGYEENGQAWILQAWGQIEVTEVDVLELARMPVDVIRLLRNQETAPDLGGQTVAGQPVRLADLQGSWVLLNFAMLGSPEFAETCRAMGEARQSADVASQLKILTVAVDKDPDVVEKFVADQAIDWACIVLGGWDTTVLNQYGVKSVPSLWLIDPDGRIAVTGQQFLQELGRSGRTIPGLVADAISGTLELRVEPSADEAGVNQPPGGIP